MRLDLNDQLQKGQDLIGDDGRKKKKIAIGLAIAFGVSLILLIIFATAFFVKTMDRFLDPNATPSRDHTGSYSYSGNEDELAQIAWGTKGEGTSSPYFSQDNSNSNFVYGTVSGTSYYSTFSGVKFNAPADWNLSGYVEGNFSNILAPTDLKASNGDMSASVSINYKSMTNHLYSSAAEALKNYVSQAETGNSQMINDSASASFGGNKFNGVIYKKTLDANYTYYIEVLVAEVNGYVLEIYVEAGSADQLASVMAMFS